MAKTIFVADDDQGILDAITMLLEEEGFVVHTYQNTDLLSEIRAAHPDVLLLDIWMSGVDGSRIAEELRKDSQTEALPIIMISARQDLEEIATAVNADAFVSKPFEINELLEKIETAMAHH